MEGESYRPIILWRDLVPPLCIGITLADFSLALISELSMDFRHMSISGYDNDFLHFF